MKRHEQLIIQGMRNTRRIKAALRCAVRKLTAEQLKVFIQYMKKEKNRGGYETCTPWKMVQQLAYVISVSLGSNVIHFSFRGSYGDPTSLNLPISFLDNAKGRQAAVDRLKRGECRNAWISSLNGTFGNFEFFPVDIRKL